MLLRVYTWGLLNTQPKNDFVTGRIFRENAGEANQLNVIQIPCNIHLV